MEFTGNAFSLFKKYIVWWALGIITLGFYFVLKLDFDIIKWKTENTHVKGREGQKSYLDAEWYQHLRARIVSGLMVLLTLGIGYAWAHCSYREWLCWHTYIDGNSFNFDGEGKEYLKKSLLWALLTVVTVGIYYIWFISNVVKFDTGRTDFKYKESVVAGKTVLIKNPVPALPKPVEPVDKPVLGENYKRIHEFMKLKRAMLCFTFEIPFIAGVTVLLAYTLGFFTCIVAPLLLWFVVLLSLPAIFIPEERVKSVDELKLKSVTALSITGLIFSLAIPLFMPVFIYGVIETDSIKKWIYGTEQPAKDCVPGGIGGAILSEQEEYFSASEKYQKYLGNCHDYKKAMKNYAKSVIEYNKRLKACENALNNK